MSRHVTTFRGAVNQKRSGNGNIINDLIERSFAYNVSKHANNSALKVSNILFSWQINQPPPPLPYKLKRTKTKQVKEQKQKQQRYNIYRVAHVHYRGLVGIFDWQPDLFRLFL